MTRKLRTLIFIAFLMTLSTLGVSIVIMSDDPIDTKPVASTFPTAELILTTTTTTTTPATSTTTTTIDVQAALVAELNAIEIPTYPEIACARVEKLGSNKYLDRVEGLCLPIAEAYLDLIEGEYGIAEQLAYLPPAPGDELFVLEFMTQDVIHMLYVMSFESGGDPLANGRNWGCPGQPAIRELHPSPKECPWHQSRVPIGWVSHMAHTLEDRSNRTLGFLIDPYDLYQSALLGYALVFETGGNGWYHWWHIHWSLNSYLTPLGIIGVYHCPDSAYWQNVRGGQQTCPYA